MSQKQKRIKDKIIVTNIEDNYIVKEAKKKEFEVKLFESKKQIIKFFNKKLAFPVILGTGLIFFYSFGNSFKTLNSVSFNYRLNEVYKTFMYLPIFTVRFLSFNIKLYILDWIIHWYKYEITKIK